MQLSHYPWLTVASFAVVGQDGSLLDTGRVRHWRLSSYSAELWAVLAAFAMAKSPLVIHSDSLTIVNQFNELLSTDQVRLEWTHTNWWGFLHLLIHQRKAFFEPPLQMTWCPPHLLESVSSDDVTDEAAAAVGSTRQDIVLNRLADHFAKQSIHALAKGIKADLATHENDVFARQLWLAKINKFCKKPEGTVQGSSRPVVAPASTLSPRELCPRWAWDVSPELYTWSVRNEVNLSFSPKPQLSEVNFRIFLQFSNSLCWRLGEGLATSVFELAAYAFKLGWRFDLPKGTLCTFQAYAALIRAAFSYCKAKHIVVGPLLLDKKNKCNGRTFPKGAFVGAEAYIDNPTLELLCRAFEKGAKATPFSWSIPFDSVL